MKNTSALFKPLQSDHFGDNWLQNKNIIIIYKEISTTPTKAFQDTLLEFSQDNILSSTEV